MGIDKETKVVDLINNLKDQRDEARKERDNALNQVIENRKKIKQLMDENKKLMDKCDDYNHCVGSLNKSNRYLTDRLSAQTDACSDLQKEIDDLKLEKSWLESSINEYRDRIRFEFHLQLKKDLDDAIVQAMKDKEAADLEKTLDKLIRG